MTPGPNHHFHTTIKVTSDLRDRLKAQAEEKGLTLGEQLAYLVELADRESRYEEVAAAIAATPADQLASYAEETEFWDQVAGG